MTNPQAHSYGSMPFGSWDVSSTEDNPMADLNQIESGALSRLKGLGFDDDQAKDFVDLHGSSVVRSASNAALKRHLAVAEVSDDYDPAEHNVDDVLAYVGDDAVKAEAVMAAEKSGKNRKTLLAELADLPVPSEVGESDSRAGGTSAVPVAD